MNAVLIVEVTPLLYYGILTFRRLTFSSLMDLTDLVFGIIFSGFVPLCCAIRSDRHDFIFCIVGLETSRCAAGLDRFDVILFHGASGLHQQIERVFAHDTFVDKVLD